MKFFKEDKNTTGDGGKDPFIRVGITVRHHGFGHQTFLNEPKGVEFIRGWDFPFHYLTNNYLLVNTHLFIGPPDIDLFHVWDGVAVNNRPWVVSFQWTIPRYENISQDHWMYKWGVSKLKSKHCKAILPACDFAKRVIQSYSWYDEETDRKTRTLLYAVQKVEPKPIKKAPGEIWILFVGFCFFLKGGHLLYHAFEKLLPKYPNLRLVVVSTMESDDWVTKTSPDVVAEYRRILENHPRVNFHNYVDHKALMEEFFPAADIFVFPTFADTFGLVAVEALSAGVPVVGTAVNAMPEIVTSGVDGELIDVPVDSIGARSEYSPAVDEHITRELIRILADLIEKPEKRRYMSQNALKKWDEKFSAKRRADEIVDLYRSIMDGSFGK